jgi:hypothetical protein
MSDEEAEDVEIDPRHRRRHDHRRAHDHRKGGMTAAAIKASESPVTVVLARLSMIAIMPVLGILAWFVMGLVDDVRGGMKDQGAALQQVLVNQARDLAEGESQKQDIAELKESVKQLWRQVMGRENGN